MLIEGMNKEKHDVPLLYPQATFCKGIFDFWQGFREGFMACASNTLNISGISLSISLKNAGGGGGTPYTASLLLPLPGGKDGS